MTTDERQTLLTDLLTLARTSDTGARWMGDIAMRAHAVLAALPQAQAETVNAIERSLVRQIVLSCTPGEGVQYRLRERMLAEIDKLPILDAVPVIAEERADG